MKKMIIEYNCELEEKQINYVFQRIITYLAVACYYEEYVNDKQLIIELLNMIIKWKINYDETKKISLIDDKDINYIDNSLYDLDGKYLANKGLYIENAYEWFGQLKNLINKERGTF